MLKRCGLALLLVIQALGGGAITLAHARDVVVASPTVETSHDARCGILHDEVRCALGHYAAARVVIQQILFAPRADAPALHFVHSQSVVSVQRSEYATAPTRGPPPHLS